MLLETYTTVQGSELLERMPPFLSLGEFSAESAEKMVGKTLSQRAMCHSWHAPSKELFRRATLLLQKNESLLRRRFGKCFHCVFWSSSTGKQVTGDSAFSMFNLSLKEDWKNNKKFCHRLSDDEDEHNENHRVTTEAQVGDATLAPFCAL